MMCRTCDRKKGCPTRKLGRVIGCHGPQEDRFGLREVDWMPARFLPVAGAEDGCYGNKPQEPGEP
ncbi:MAG: hypothetical protein NT130_03485 [Candidatus Micrarchaeota archaeon]|nr:hypothetical protein [Candidatus Micrarchaeota archaeon]